MIWEPRTSRPTGLVAGASVDADEASAFPGGEKL
jgi:hypothetical protein